MDIDLIKQTVDRMVDRNQQEFSNLAETHGMAFAASVMTTALAHSFGLVLAMGRTEDVRKATMIGFAAVADKATAEYGSSIEMLETLDRVKR